MTIEQDYAEPVLTKMRKALKGNGVRADKVTIKNFDGEMIEFKAATHVHLNNNITEKTLPGKVSEGHVSQDRQTAYKDAQNHISKALQNPGTMEQIKNTLNQKPHQGFGLDNQAIKLAFLDHKFTSHESCQPCHGRGATKCPQCKGKGYEPCTHCNAQGFTRCEQCHGNRQVRGADGQMHTCNLCQGLGKTSCSFCRENRQVQCRVCKTKGETRCKSCGGQGAQSHIISAEIVGQCAYDFDVGSIPDDAVPIIKELGADLADQAEIKLASDQEDSVDEQQNVVHVLYNVKVPQGNVEFAIKDEVVKAYLFGKQANIKTMPDFLDRFIAPGSKKLSQAADGQGNINEAMRAAVKYKTVRQAVMLATKYNAKKAAKALLHYTPLGLSTQLAQKLIVDSNAAIKNATKQQSKIAIGGALAAIVLAAAVYYFTPLRTLLMEQVANEALHIALDITAFGLCAVIGYGVWQTIASRARKQALKSFMPAK